MSQEPTNLTVLFIDPQMDRPGPGSLGAVEATEEATQ